MAFCKVRTSITGITHKRPLVHCVGQALNMGHVGPLGPCAWSFLRQKSRRMEAKVSKFDSDGISAVRCGCDLQSQRSSVKVSVPQSGLGVDCV